MAKSLVEMLGELDEAPSGGVATVAEPSFIDPSVDEGVSEAEKKHRRKLRSESDDKKRAQAWLWRRQGIGVTAIAGMYGVDESTVYRWLNQYVEEHRTRLEQQPAANLIQDSILFYQHLEDLCLHEVTHMDGDGAEVDLETGRVKRTGDNTRKGLKMKFIQTAAKVRDSRIKLMIETGILPREPEKVYHKLEEAKRVDGEVVDDTKAKTKEDLKERLKQLVKRERSLDDDGS